MTTIQTYLCNKHLSAISVAGRPNSAISVSDGVVKAKIVPVGFNPNLKTVYAKIIGLGANPVDCIDPEPFLKWTRKALVTSNGDFAQLERLITIEGNIPDLPCFWESAHIYGVTLSPANHRMLLASVPDRSGGEIPSSKSDVSRLGSALTLRNAQTNIVPGELLQLAWTIKVDDKVYSKPVAGAWFEGPSVTGGKLIGKVDDENTNRYIANVIGVNQECLATDWAQYPSGSWVYIFKQEGPQATICNRQSEYNQSHFEAFVFRIAPITVNGYGNEGGAFEKKSYSLLSGGSEFARLFEASLHSGIILEVYTDTDKARVSVQKLGPDRDQAIEFNHVPIYYHCEDNETVAGGSAAFAENDEVIVLNEGGGCSPSVDDLTVIGFKEDVKRCIAGNIIIISETRFVNEWWTLATPVYDTENPSLIVDYAEYVPSGKAIVWNVETGSQMDVVETDGSIAVQPLNYLRLAWLMKKGANGNVIIEQDTDNPVYIRYKDVALYDYCPHQIIPTPYGFDSVVKRLTFQTNELKPSGYVEGGRSLYAFLRFRDKGLGELTGYEDKITYMAEVSLGNHPDYYYNQWVSPIDEANDAWEHVCDVRDIYSMTVSTVYTTPDADLQHMESANGYFIDMKNPAHADFKPCAYVGYRVFPYLECTGDNHAVKRGSSLSVKTTCNWRINFSWASWDYFNCEGSHNREYTYNSFLFGKVPVIFNRPYEEGISHKVPPGYSYPYNARTGIHEDTDIAVAFEYYEFTLDKYVSFGDFIENVRHREFGVYTQKKIEGEEYKMENFAEILNMATLRNLVYTQLNFQITENFYGAFLSQPTGANSITPPGEKVPIISFFKLN